MIVKKGFQVHGWKAWDNYRVLWLLIMIVVTIMIAGYYYSFIRTSLMVMLMVLKFLMDKIFSPFISPSFYCFV
jgi:hypothetical protein